MNRFFSKSIKWLAYRGTLNLLPDKMYLKLLFHAHMGYKLNLEKPKSYNEKLQWLKLYDRKEIYTNLVDKYEVKEIIGNKIGREYIIPTIGVWDTVEEIDFDILPDKFVLKCTHDSGGIIVCKNKNEFDVDEAKRKLKKSLKGSYYHSGREWPYLNIKPRIIAEEYIGDIEKVPEDYKFYTFNGEIDSVMICKDRDKGYPNFFFYDMEWNRLVYQNEEPKIDKPIEKPENFDRMIDIVNILSKDFVQIRVDLYNINGKIYFGELTFFNQSGFDTDITYDTDAYWGSKFELPERS